MARSLRQLLVLGSATACMLFSSLLWAQDPPSRVARLNYIRGPVSMEPAGTEGWTEAVINRPFTTDDYLWTDEGGRAELHLDDSVLRLNSRTSFGFLNLDDRTVQMKLAEGEVEVHVRELGSDETYEIDTPSAAIALQQPGDYRVVTNPDDGVTSVVVRRGSAQISGGGTSFQVPAGQSARLVGDQSVSYNIEPAPGRDSFDQFCAERDFAEQRAARQTQYVPPDVIGYEDLASYGDWRSTPEYDGYAWYPRVAAGWAPYRNGHWAWIDPWGWTWVDDAPWGFAPFHYGRWAFLRGGWGWIPSRDRTRHVYAPALVAFVGGNGLSRSVGPGPEVGWLPLGPGEVYAPAYHVSPTYFRQVNVTNTRINNSVNITNVYNNYYVNRTNNINIGNVNTRFVNARVNNAVTVMPSQAFASGRPVTGAGRPLPTTELARLQGIAIAPAVAPTREAVVPQPRNVRAPQPPRNINSTKVFTRSTPPPPAPPFQARQQLIQQNGGRPLTVQQLRQLGARVAPAYPAVRPVTVPANQPTRVQAGGNPPAVQNPQQIPERTPVAAQPAPVVENERTQPQGPSPNSPAVVNRGGQSEPNVRRPEPNRGFRPANPPAPNAAPGNQQPEFRRQQTPPQQNVRPQQQDRYRSEQEQGLRQQQEMRQRQQQIQQQQVQQEQIHQQQIHQQQMEQQHRGQQQDQMQQQQMREQQMRQQEQNRQDQMRQQQMRQQQQQQQQQQREPIRQQEIRPSRPEPQRNNPVQQAPRQERAEPGRQQPNARDRSDK